MGEEEKLRPCRELSLTPLVVQTDTDT
jgi:hypothetical protein